MNFINFGKGSLDFLKDFKKREIILIVSFCLVLAFSLRNQIESILSEPIQAERDIFREGIEEALEVEYILNDIASQQSSS